MSGGVVSTDLHRARFASDSMEEFDSFVITAYFDNKLPRHTKTAIQLADYERIAILIDRKSKTHHPKHDLEGY